jgi:signal transduction histidine kinase
MATSVEDVPATGVRRPRIAAAPRTIRAKLGLAFGVVAVTAIVAGVVGQSAYEVVNEKLTTITEVSVPSMVAAQRIGEVTARIAAAAPALHGAETESELSAQLARLNAYLGELQAGVDLLAELSDDAEGVRRLGALAGRVARMIEVQADNVEGRRVLAERSHRRMEQLIDEHLRFNNAIVPTIEAAKLAFAVSSQQIVEATEQSVDHLNQLSMRGLFPVLMLRVQANNMARALGAGQRAETAAGIDEPWQSFVGASSVASRQLAEIERNPALAGLFDIEPLRAVLGRLTSLGAGDGNIFDRRREQLGALAGADGQALTIGELEADLAALEAELERSLNLMITLIRGRTATGAVDLHQGVSSMLERMTTEGLDRLSNLQELEALGNQVVGVLTVAKRLESEADLDVFAARFTPAAERMDSILARYTGDPSLAQIGESVGRILGLGRGEDDLFAERRAELRAIAHGRELLAESLGLVEELSATAAGIVATTRAGSERSTGAAAAALERARWTLFGAGSAGLLTLVIVWLYARRSLVGPIRALQEGAARIGRGDLDSRIAIGGGDEIQALAGDFNRMAARLRESYASLERKVEERTRELTESLERQTATSDVLNVISRSTAELQPVLDTIIVTAARLCRAEWGIIFKLGDDDRYLPASANKADEEFLRYLAKNPISPGRGTLIGRTALEGRTVHIPDVLADAEYTWAEAQARGGFRTLLGVPLLRGGKVIGVINLHRESLEPFSDKEIELVTTFADQAVIAIENVRLFEEVQARTDELTGSLERQTATSEVLGIISRSTTELQPVLDTIVTTAARLCHAEWAVIVRLESDGRYHLAAVSEADADFVRYVVEHPLTRERGSIAGRTAVEGRTVHVPDVLEDPEFTQLETQAIAGFRSMLGVPLLRGTAVIGVIVLARNVVRPYSDKEIELVTTFADQAVIAIENVRLFDEVQARTRELGEALEQQTATADVLKVISRSTFDLQKVLDTLVGSAAVLCRAEKAGIVREIDGVYRYVSTFGYSPEFEAFLDRHQLPMGRGSAVGRAVVEGRTVQIEDVLADPDYTAHGVAEAGDFRTALAVPLLREGSLVGVLALTRAEVQPFTRQQIELVTTFADQAVIAIENVRLFDEVQARTRELQRSVRDLETLGEVSRAVNASLDLDAVLGSIAAHAVAVSGTDAGLFYAYDDDARVFRPRAAHEFDPGLVEAFTERPIGLGMGAIGQAGLQRRAVQIPDIDAAPDYPIHDMVRLPGYRALLAVPLLREQTLVGGLGLVRKSPGPFARETVSLVQTLANQSVLAIENAELFQEIERKSRELAAANRHKSEFLANMSHELRTPLNAVLGYAELIEDGIYGEVPEKIREVMERIQENGRHLLGLINDVLDLSKIEAGQLSLAPVDYALRELVLGVTAAMESLAASKGLALEVEIPDGLPPARADERRITQVLMNLVGNAIKFTEAGKVAIRVSMEGEAFRVEVSDTGPGIAEADRERIFQEFQQVDSSSTRKKGGTGLGLAIARRIVELHGGRIWVESTPGVGSTFAFTLPIGERACETVDGDISLACCVKML